MSWIEMLCLVSLLANVVLGVLLGIYRRAIHSAISTMVVVNQIMDGRLDHEIRRHRARAAAAVRRQATDAAVTGDREA